MARRACFLTYTKKEPLHLIHSPPRWFCFWLNILSGSDKSSAGILLIKSCWSLQYYGERCWPCNFQQKPEFSTHVRFGILLLHPDTPPSLFCLKNVGFCMREPGYTPSHSLLPFPQIPKPKWPAGLVLATFWWDPPCVIRWRGQELIFSFWTIIIHH